MLQRRSTDIWPVPLIQKGTAIIFWKHCLPGVLIWYTAAIYRNKQTNKKKKLKEGKNCISQLKQQHNCTLTTTKAQTALASSPDACVAEALLLVVKIPVVLSWGLTSPGSWGTKALGESPTALWRPLESCHLHAGQSQPSLSCKSDGFTNRGAAAVTCFGEIHLESKRQVRGTERCRASRLSTDRESKEMTDEQILSAKPHFSSTMLAALTAWKLIALLRNCPKIRTKETASSTPL